MTGFGSPSPPSSPAPSKRRRRNCTRKCERCCCVTFTYLPLVFVYGLTTWAVWVQSKIGFGSEGYGWIASIFGIALYLLLNLSYTVAVIVSPGSPASSRGVYSHLPTSEPASTASLTVKSTGGTRFCKKCQTRKPDRAHHCSTCKRCVLKMDHHCPWLATCVGFRNYKAFLLFLIYTTVFCWSCAAISARWLWTEVFMDDKYMETFMPVNYVLLAVIAGIFGLVLTGFTGWHVSLAWRNQTTIECLEKTRYLSPLRQSMQLQHYEQTRTNGSSPPSYGQQLREIHTNALPGVTRPEEGEERRSPGGGSRVSTGRPDAQQLLQRNYNDLEQARERERYEDYLDEKDSETLPNAFDLGWRRNLQHLFGPSPLFWWLPVCNTSGDGWHWEPNPRWVEAREELRRARDERSTWDQEHGSESWQHHRDGAGGGRHFIGDTEWREGASSLAQPPSHAGAPPRRSEPSSREWSQDPDDQYDTSSDEEEATSQLRRNDGGGWGRHKVTGRSNQREGVDDWQEWNERETR